MLELVDDQQRKGHRVGGQSRRDRAEGVSRGRADVPARRPGANGISTLKPAAKARDVGGMTLLDLAARPPAKDRCHCANSASVSRAAAGH